MNGCRCCGTDLSRMGHAPNCENLDPEPEDEWDDEWEEDDELPFDDDEDDDGGPDFDPYAGGVIFDEGGEDE